MTNTFPPPKKEEDKKKKKKITCKAKVKMNSKRLQIADQEKRLAVIDSFIQNSAKLKGSSGCDS